MLQSNLSRHIKCYAISHGNVLVHYADYNEALTAGAYATIYMFKEQLV